MEELYKSLMKGREEDSQRFWTIFSVMNVINVGLLAVVIAKEPNLSLKTIAAIIGIILCIFWFLAGRRITGWIDWWEQRLSEVEPMYFAEVNRAATRRNLPQLPPNFRLFIGRTINVCLSLSSRKVGWLLPILFLCAWVFILISTLSRKTICLIVL